MNKLSGKKILITGGLGFIGSNLAHACVAAGAEVHVYDCLDPRSGGNLYNVEGIRDKASFHFLDILNFDLLTTHMVNQDIVFNCAASTSHPFSMREPWIDMDVNVRGVINLLEAMRRFNPSARFIHVGTSTQLGRLLHQPADETHSEFPTDIYSANKCVSEKYVLIYARAYGLRATVIRLANVFGPRATINSPDFTVNNYFIGLALQGREITVYGDGRQKRNVLYVDDAVKALMSTALSDAMNGETFFATSDDHYSVAEIAEWTVKCMGSGGVRYVPWPHERKMTEVGDTIISNRKIKERLGWIPVHSLEDGLNMTRDYYRRCLDKYLK